MLKSFKLTCISSPSLVPPFMDQLVSFPIIIKKQLCYTLAVLIISSSVLLLNLGDSFGPLSLFRFGFLSSEKTCDYSYGKWVREECSSFQMYGENCPFLDPGFQCRRNGRKDVEYLKWRWHPHGCDLPMYVSFIMLLCFFFHFKQKCVV